MKTDEVHDLGGTKTTNSGGAKTTFSRGDEKTSSGGAETTDSEGTVKTSSGGTQKISLGETPETERLPVADDVTETEDESESDSGACNSNWPSSKMSTSLEEALAHADLYTVLLKEPLVFHLKDDH